MNIQKDADQTINAFRRQNEMISVMVEVPTHGNPIKMWKNGISDVWLYEDGFLKEVRR